MALEDRATLALALGDDATAAAELEALTAAYPLREQLWALRAVALARGGRQADALDVLGPAADACSTRSSGSSRARRSSTCRRRCCARTPIWSGSPSPRRPGRGTGRAAADRAVRAVVGPAWPLVGRDAQLARLVGRLDEAVAGTPAFVALTGDPGIGKTRLCAELVGVARERGVRVVVGRCSQDDGAPPLWPWQQVLTHARGRPRRRRWRDEGAEFRIVGRPRPPGPGGRAPPSRSSSCSTTCTGPTPSSLRVLRLLLDTVQRRPPAAARPPGARTRSRPGRWPTSPSRSPGGTRPASRSPGSASPTSSGSSHGRRPGRRSPARRRTPWPAAPTATRSSSWSTPGWPASRGGLGTLVDEADPPTAVGDVLTRRLDRLPDESRGGWSSWAAVIGRDFELEVLAEVAGALRGRGARPARPGRRRRLVRERRAGDFVFAHALVRDTAYAATRPDPAGPRPRRRGRGPRPPRRARAPSPPGTGSAPVPRTRRAPGGRRRARPRRRGPCTPTSRPPSLLEAALDRMDDDPERLDADRYRLLMALADAHRWQRRLAARWCPRCTAPSRSPAGSGTCGSLADAASSLAHRRALADRGVRRRRTPQVVAALRGRRCAGCRTRTTRCAAG